MKVPIENPATLQTTPAIVNQALLDEYSAITTALRGDAELVMEKATAMNQKEYVVLFSEKSEGNNLFPSPDSEGNLQTLPQQFYASLKAEYEMLLPNINAGSPVDSTELASYP